MTIMIYTLSLSSCLVQNFEMFSNLISSWYKSVYPSRELLLVKLMKTESYSS